MFGPVVDGDVDREDDVKQKHGQDEEVVGGIKAFVILKILRSGHRSPFGTACAGGPQHTTLCDRLEGWRLV